MNRDFLQYCEQELNHLKGMGAEYYREFTKVAGRFGLEEFDCADPYVERLRESFAFLCARIQYKLDAEFPRFTQAFFETVFPHYLAPTPSMVIVQFQPELAEGALAAGYPIPRGRRLFGLLGKGDRTQCEYRTAHDVVLWPLELTEAAYHTQDLSGLALPPGIAGAAALRLRLRCAGAATFEKLPLKSLTLYIRGADKKPMRIYEQLLAQAAAVVVRPAARPVKAQQVLPASCVRRVGFRDEEALLPPSPRSFEGYRLLHEYFAFRERFLFVEIADLEPALRTVKGQEAEVIVPLKKADLALEGDVDATHFALHATPAINLFPRGTDRIQVKERDFEFQVVPDRTRPLDFEVYRVQTVTGYGAGNADAREFRPFYSWRDHEGEPGGGAYFTVHRVPRPLTEKEREQGLRYEYAGSESYISIVDTKEPPYSPKLKQLAVTALCTNRGLPGQLPIGVTKTDFTADGGPPVRAVRCIGGPTSPRPSRAHGELSWKLINHLSLNYLTLNDTDEARGAAALRELLGLYAEMAKDPGKSQVPVHVEEEIKGVRSIAAAPIVRRLDVPGPIAFGRGLEVSLTFDESDFKKTGVFLLGAVLSEFFAKFVSINSFTETLVKTRQRGEIMRWPPKVGRRPVL